ncbi:pyridoxal 5'-phosphate synthase lyase subunit PdxS [Candidatus Atribacteria bacterium HGW-Atribacteria-1]|nr:MAG: pyridoxal 5'-phosphate synthase lyase subunit PdxS [Candidatus Atribacteria bacterium HGW-Atribacteria-1]
MLEKGTYRIKKGLAEMLKGGVIMDVVNAEQAKIAEEAGAVAVMALERVPADIRSAGGVARMADPKIIKEIMNTVTIPVMAKARIGHLRRIGEGAAMIRTKGEPGTGNIVEAVRHMREVIGEIRRLKNIPKEELMTKAKELGAPFELLQEVAQKGRLPVVNFAAGGIATPADAALMMQLGADGVFVGSGIFKSDDPKIRARAIVEATTHFDNPKIIAQVSEGLGEAMKGIEISQIAAAERMQDRGW